MEKHKTSYVTTFVLIGLCLFVLSGCSQADSQGQGEEAGGETLSVFAAAQLQDAFTELKEVFEEKHDVDVSINFAGSQVVRTQIEQGAPADVFASADLEHMEDLQQLGRVGEDTIFSHNTLTVLLPVDNPGNLERLEELDSKDYKLVVGVETVPIGKYARAFLKKAEDTFGSNYKENVLENVVSLETNTRAVSGKITLKEADAGIVYVTDVIPSIEDQVTTIEIPEDLNVITNNTIAVVSDAPNPDLAQQWVDFTLSEEGQDILAKHKFMKISNVIE
nr:molybdate ABC transporter substrate-binding protein [Caldalkalibacillus salinus]